MRVFEYLNNTTLYFSSKLRVISSENKVDSIKLTVFAERNVSEMQ